MELVVAMFRSRKEIIAVAATVFFWTACERNALALCDPTFPDRCSVAMQPDEPAPFAGQLISPELAITLGQKSANCDDRCDLALAKSSSIALAVLRAEKAKSAIDVQSAEKIGFVLGRVEGYEAGFDAASPSWYERPTTVAILTAVVTVGIFFAIKAGDRALERSLP